MRVISTFLLVVFIGLFVWVAATTGISNPKALLGGIILILSWGYYAVYFSALERKRKMPDFIAERKRVIGALPKGSDFSTALNVLGTVYQSVGDSRSISISGRIRVVDFSSPLAVVRVESKEARITNVSCSPTPDGTLGERISTLKTAIPPDRTPRDWMGNPVDRE